MGVHDVSGDRTLVAATSVETGRFAVIERSVDRDELIRLVDQLSSMDEGYLEVHPLSNAYPTLLVGFGRRCAVVQCMSSADSMALLMGDGSVVGAELVDVLIMDDLASYTGEYVMACARAREVLLKFAEGADVLALGEWHEL